MTNRSPAGQIIRSLIDYRHWLLAPVFVCTLLAVLYSLFATKTYTSRQSLVIRDNLVGTFFKPGRFDSLDSMKSAQETILEISRRPRVVRAALEKLGPPGFKGKSWLTDQVIMETQGRIQLGAPNGAEFGRTEAVVLSVQDSSRERSHKFITLLLDEIEISLRDLRGTQFKSMQKELAQAANMAQKSYSDSAKMLKKFEGEVGPDLATLISMNDSQSGTNTLQSELTTLNAEKRRAWANLQDVEKQIQILEEVRNNPEAIMEVPQELLQLQPTMASLALGLNEAVITYSTNKGRYKPIHPRVRESARAVSDIKQQINDKLIRTLDSLNYQMELRKGKFEQVEKLVAAQSTRLGELSGMRVDHQSLKAEVMKKREINGKAQASLAEVSSLGSSASDVNLISRIDEPQTEIYADGPSNKLIVLGGMLAGLMIGIGLVLFVVPIDENEQSSDLFDPSPTVPPQRNQNESAVTPSRSNRSATSAASSPSSHSSPPSSPATTQQREKVGKSLSDFISQVEPSSSSGKNPPIGSSKKPKVSTVEVPEIQPAGPVPTKDGFVAEPNSGQSFAAWEESEVAIATQATHGQGKPSDQTRQTSAPVRTLENENDPYHSILADIPDLNEVSDRSDAIDGTLAEKISQIDQLEQFNQGGTESSDRPIENYAAKAVEDLAGDPPSASNQSSGLPLPTSNEQSSAEATGHESDPKFGIQPDSRPTASPVDLEMLRRQIAARSADTESPKKLSQVLAPTATDLSDQKNMVVDKSIADLAQSIRDMCEGDDLPG